MHSRTHDHATCYHESTEQDERNAISPSFPGRNATRIIVLKSLKSCQRSLEGFFFDAWFDVSWCMGRFYLFFFRSWWLIRGRLLVRISIWGSVWNRWHLSCALGLNQCHILWWTKAGSGGSQGWIRLNLYTGRMWALDNTHAFFPAPALFSSSCQVDAFRTAVLCSTAIFF